MLPDRKRLVVASLISLLCEAPEARAEDPEGGASSAYVPIDVSAGGTTDRPFSEGRAGSRVDAGELRETLPRSAPDALRYEPGVYVQQTAHAQASPFVRGRTGQQVLLLFDGIRLNNSTFRQGPNQYFFTVDARSVHSIEVIRGGASTAFGSDAIAGVVHARPIEPQGRAGETLGLGFGGKDDGGDPKPQTFSMRPRVFTRGASADSDFGFRLAVEAQYTNKARFFGGFGSRRAGELRAGGPVCSPGTTSCVVGSPEQALVPRFRDDGRTQRGTGFRELTGDARLVFEPAPGQRVIAAAYLYRQFDAPRTDQCPPALASVRECLKLDEQFRTLAYVSYRGRGPAFAQKLEATLSFQRQHERRTRDRPQSFIQNIGRDSVSTWGALVRAQSATFSPASWLKAEVKYGADSYFDTVESAAWLVFTDNETTIAESRGQHIDGSTYTQTGAYADIEVKIADRVGVRTGARGGFARAVAASDPQTASLPVDATFPVVVGHGGVDVRIVEGWSVTANIDRSFRAPNLDDLTSRQQTGPGFQIENSKLEPEMATTLEVGTQVSLPFLEADVWVYQSILEAAIQRRVANIQDCPPETPSCAASASRYKLVNLSGPAVVTGGEASLKAWLPFGLEGRASVSYAFGEGPNPQPKPEDPAIAYEPVVPLSRIPPLNGSLEMRVALPFGAYLGTGIRWATTQDRLAISDRSDARIPKGGTPGFVVWDARAGIRMKNRLLLSMVLENLTDAAYRYHGSSVNGPERSITVGLEGGL